MTALTLGAGAVLVASIAISLFSSDRVAWNGGCGDDGLEYCRMALGHEARQPWSRRFLLPSGLHLLGISRPHLVDSFLVVNVLALVFTALATAVLTWRIARMLGAVRSRARAAALLSLPIVLLFPFAFHWTLFYPVLIDDFSLVFAMSWFLLATTKEPRWQWVAIAPAALAVLSRESWLVVIASAVLARMLVARRRESIKIGVVSLLALAVCGALVFTRKGLPNPTTEDVFAYAGAHLRRWFTSFYGFKELCWMMFFSLGVIPLIQFRKLKVVSALWQAEPRQRILVSQLIVVVGALVVVSISLGSDVHRYLFAAAPFVTALALATVARYPPLDLELILCVTASLLVWSPFARLDGSRARYLEFFSPQYTGMTSERLRADLRVSAPALLAWLILIVIKSRNPPRVRRRVPRFR